MYAAARLGQMSVPILMYHSVSGSQSAPGRRLAVDYDVFIEQMELLHRLGYTTLTISELADHLRGEASLRDLPGRPAALTFDDGFADFASHALPVLKALSFRSTLYVTTGFVDASERPYQLRRARAPMLTWGQLEDLLPEDVEIGSHGCAHIALDVSTPARVRDEVERSRQVLCRRLGAEVQSFAYPFGYTGPMAQQAVKDAGYTSACAVKHGLSSMKDDLFALTRIEVTSRTSLGRFQRWVQGIGLPVAPSRPRLRTAAWRVPRQLVRSRVGVKHG